MVEAGAIVHWGQLLISSGELHDKNSANRWIENGYLNVGHDGDNYTTKIRKCCKLAFLSNKPLKLNNRYMSLLFYQAYFCVSLKTSDLFPNYFSRLLRSEILLSLIFQVTSHYAPSETEPLKCTKCSEHSRSIANTILAFIQDLLAYE